MIGYIRKSTSYSLANQASLTASTFMMDTPGANSTPVNFCCVSSAVLECSHRHLQHVKTIYELKLSTPVGHPRLGEGQQVNGHVHGVETHEQQSCCGGEQIPQLQVHLFGSALSQ